MKTRLLEPLELSSEDLYSTEKVYPHPSEPTLPRARESGLRVPKPLEFAIKLVGPNQTALPREKKGSLLARMKEVGPQPLLNVVVDEGKRQKASSLTRLMKKNCQYCGIGFVSPMAYRYCSRQCQVRMTATVGREGSLMPQRLEGYQKFIEEHTRDRLFRV